MYWHNDQNIVRAIRKYGINSSDAFYPKGNLDWFCSGPNIFQCTTIIVKCDKLNQKNAVAA